MKRLLILLFAACAFMPVQAFAQTCGNDIPEPPEECDDGNLADGDGCSAVCAYEPATHDQLRVLMGNQDLKDRVEVSIVIMVDKILRSEDTTNGFDQQNHANRVVWARRIMNDPQGAPKEAARFFPIMVAANRDLSILQILAATDEGIQLRVEETVDFFADGT